MTTKADDWSITTERYVGFIDIMGFKDMVARNTHDKIYQMMKVIDGRIKSNMNIIWGDTKDVGLVKTTTYSDSIMIYSKDSTKEALHSFACTVSSLTGDLFLEHVPHKGAFAFGQMTLDSERSIFFGQPLIDAYLLQDELQFYGVVGHASAEKAIVDQGGTVFTRNYLCPFKGGIASHMTIIPMPMRTLIKPNPETEKEAEKIYESIHKLRFQTSGYLRKYIENTEAYLKTIKQLLP